MRARWCKLQARPRGESGVGAVGPTLGEDESDGAAPGEELPGRGHTSGFTVETAEGRAAGGGDHGRSFPVGGWGRPSIPGALGFDPEYRDRISSAAARWENRRQRASISAKRLRATRSALTNAATWKSHATRPRGVRSTEDTDGTAAMASRLRIATTRDDLIGLPVG